MKASPNRFISANLPVNKFKNRLVNILPCKYRTANINGPSIFGISYLQSNVPMQLPLIY